MIENGAVRLVEITDRSTFAQELRAGDHCKWNGFWLIILYDVATSPVPTGRWIY